MDEDKKQNSDSISIIYSCVRSSSCYFFTSVVRKSLTCYCNCSLFILPLSP